MRLKTLNGAPLCEQLDFSEDVLLKPSSVQNLFSSSLKRKNAPTNTGNDDSVVVKWRHLDAKPSKLHSGWSQPYLPKGGIFVATPDLSYTDLQIGKAPNSVAHGSLPEDTTYTFEEDSKTDSYLEHSLILHDTLLSSQIILNADTSISNALENSISSSSFLTTSFGTDTIETSHTIKGEGQLPVLQLPPELAIISLNAIPTAKYLRSIHPQTPTPTLLCVLTAPVEIREILVRKGTYKMHLYDLVVADDTASSGFKVSFWFRPPYQPTKQGDKVRNRQQEDVRHKLDQIKTGQVLLLRNIFLSIFRDEVFGQSLNPNISKARTTVEIMTAADGSSKFSHILPLAVEDKLARVKKWAKAHVVPVHRNTKKRKENYVDSEVTIKRLRRDTHGVEGTLPPDTMEAV
jgi:hypothetical protein